MTNATHKSLVCENFASFKFLTTIFNYLGIYETERNVYCGGFLNGLSDLHKTCLPLTIIGNEYLQLNIILYRDEYFNYFYDHKPAYYLWNVQQCAIIN